MLDLNHYKFKEIIKWYAKKYGKRIVDCNESYTSKTLSDGNIIVDRDINGARGIFLKQLTKAT